METFDPSPLFHHHFLFSNSLIIDSCYETEQFCLDMAHKITYGNDLLTRILLKYGDWFTNRDAEFACGGDPFAYETPS